MSRIGTIIFGARSNVRGRISSNSNSFRLALKLLTINCLIRNPPLFITVNMNFSKYAIPFKVGMPFLLLLSYADR